MASTETEIRDAIIDATVMKDGAEVTDYAECYLALAQDLHGTLPDGYTVEWGPRSAHNKRVIDQAPSAVWAAATSGNLTL